MLLRALVVASLAAGLASQDPNSEGPFLAVPQGMSVDTSTWSATSPGVRLSESTLYFNPAGFQSESPTPFAPLLDGLPRFEFAAMFPGIDPRLDIDAMSIGLDWVLANANGEAFVPSGGWGAITYSVTRSTIGGGVIGVEAGRPDGAAADVFAYILPGSNVPADLVDKPLRSRDSTESNLFGASGERGNIDAHDIFMSLLFQSNPDLAPADGLTFYFSVTTSTLTYAPTGWFGSTPKSGATILQTTWDGTAWSAPSPWRTAAQLGLSFGDDVDALAVDRNTGYVLLSTKNVAFDPILFWRQGLGGPVPYTVRIGGVPSPVSSRAGIVGPRSRDDVDGICALDPGRGLDGVLAGLIGRPVGAVQSTTTPSLGVACYRQLRHDGVAELVTWLCGWPPPGGPQRGNALLWRSTPSDQPAFWQSLGSFPRNLFPRFAGDPHSVTFALDPSLATAPLYLHWAATTTTTTCYAFPVMVAPAVPVSHVGKPLPCRVDIQAQVANQTGNPDFNGMLGVADARGRQFVSGRRDNSSNPHMLFEFDCSGRVIRGYQQPQATSTSAWGIRDLATDGIRLYGGLEGNTIHAFDLATSQFDPAAQIIVQGGPPTIRALAFDPFGDNGRGSFWTADFFNPVFEVARTGTILRTFPNTFGQGGAAAGIYGAAFDPVRGTVWWWSQTGGIATTAQVLGIEMDTITGRATGQRFVGDLSIAGNRQGGVAGGAEFVQRNGVPTLLVLTQATSDTVYAVEGRFNHGVTCGPRIGFSGGEPAAGNGAFRIDLTQSAGSMGFLMASVSGVPSLLQPPILNPRCFANVDLASAFVVGQWPVIGGSASFPLPIPASASGVELHLQWIALGATLPVFASDGGGLWINP